MTRPPAAAPPRRRIPLIHDRAASAGDMAARDVFRQLDAVEKALLENGDIPLRLPVSLDLRRFRSRLAALRPDVVFNLVESIDLSDRLQTLVPLVLEDCGIPFTGSGSRAMLLANHKIAAKRRLAERGLSTPPCAWLERPADSLRFLPAEEKLRVADGRWIAKTLDSHASLHLDDASVFAVANADELAARLATDAARHGQPFFAERYVEGREFNLSLLARPDGGVDILPPAEIVFIDFPDGKPRIVGHAAKWEEDSAVYAATPRRFAESPSDAGLTRTLRDLAARTWDALELAGYARVDFRVDPAGNPLILEANANPCLSPDAGFAAAADRAGIPYAELCARIVAAGEKNGL